MFLTNHIFTENNWLSFHNPSNTKYRGEGLLPRMDDSSLSMTL
jgi:hypothetical protein